MAAPAISVDFKLPAIINDVRPADHPGLTDLGL